MLVCVICSCETGHTDVVEFLIKKRVDLDAGDNFRVTAMHLAAIGEYSWADAPHKSLMICGTEATICVVQEVKCIDSFVAENHLEIIELLLAARASVKPVDVEGDLPIHWAATKGHSEAS
jgi:ankyrin repeat protein